MKLEVNFGALHQCVDKMGAADTDFLIEVDRFNPIDIDLESGIDIDLKDIEFREGILSYHGRQVLLYIPDQGRNIVSVLENAEKGRRYHVADCSTLKQMRDSNRFDRYVVTNKITGTFKINGLDYETGKQREGDAELKVCKNCLKALNYDGYASNTRNRSNIFQDFRIDTFFETYSTVFKYLPKHRNDIYAAGYTDDWVEVSLNYRKTKNFICEKCNTDFNNNKNLLHSHHINGVKSDNRYSNIKALCADCHRKEPLHNHVYIDHNDMHRIYELRRLQNKSNCHNWKDVFDFSDTALHGYLEHAKNMNSKIPEVGYILDENNNKMIFDLAWPDKKLAVVIDKSKYDSIDNGWKIISMGKEMQRLQS